jgi:hypothetical protein
VLLCCVQYANRIPGHCISWLQFLQPLQEVVVTTAQREVREIRKRLVESGADPYEVAALALEQAERYRELLAQATREVESRQLAPVVCLRPPTCIYG